jgi:hypothetical protein
VMTWLSFFSSLNKNFMLILCSKYLSFIFLMSYPNTTSVKAQQLCTRWTCQGKFATAYSSDITYGQQHSPSNTVTHASQCCQSSYLIVRPGSFMYS